MKKGSFIGLIIALIFVLLQIGQMTAAYAEEQCLPQENPFLELEKQAFDWVKPFIKDLSTEKAAQALIQYYLEKEDSDAYDLNDLLDFSKKEYPQIYKNIIKTLLEQKDSGTSPPTPPNAKIIQFKTESIKRANEFGEEFYTLLKNRLESYTPKFFPPHLHPVETRELQELVVALSAHENSSTLGRQILNDRYDGPSTFQPATQKNLKDQLVHPWLRSKIVESLGHLPSQRDFVINYLNGDNMNLKVGAIRGLGSNSQNWAILRPLFGSSDTGIQGALIDSLYNDPQAWPHIISHLESPDPSVRNAVIMAFYDSDKPFLNSYLTPLLKSSFEVENIDQIRESFFVLKRILEWKENWLSMTEEERNEIKPIVQELKNQLQGRNLSKENPTVRLIQKELDHISP